jgi:hypothetical protein
MKNRRKTPMIGTVLEHTVAGKRYELKVVSTNEGAAYELNGQVYKTLTGAARSIVKYEANGWKFWHKKKV